jgi:hypothetical protein
MAKAGRLYLWHHLGKPIAAGFQVDDKGWTVQDVVPCGHFL